MLRNHSRSRDGQGCPNGHRTQNDPEPPRRRGAHPGVRLRALLLPDPPRNRGRPRMGRAALRAPTPPGRDRLPALRSGGVPGRRRPGTAAVAALTPPDEERTCCVRAPTGVPPCGYIRNRQGDHFVWRTRGDRTLVDTWIVSAVGDLLSKGHMAPFPPSALRAAASPDRRPASGRHERSARSVREVKGAGQAPPERTRTGVREPMEERSPCPRPTSPSPSSPPPWSGSRRSRSSSGPSGSSG